MLTAEQRQILNDRVIGDDLVLSALEALCGQECQRAIRRLIDESQRRHPSPNQIAIEGAEAQFWADLPETLKRRVDERPQEAPA